MKYNIRNEIKEQIGFNVDYYSSFEQDCYNIIDRRVSESINMKLWGEVHRQVLERLMHGIQVSINSQMNNDI